MEYEIVKVIWIDAETIGDSGWQDFIEISLILDTTPPIMSTVGFLLGEYSTHLTLTDSLGDKECGHVTKIPREMIRSVEYLYGSDSSE